MNRQKINLSITNLNIQLKGVSATDAQTVVKNIGPQLAQHLAEQHTMPPQNHTLDNRFDIRQLDAGNIQLQKGDNQNPTRIREKIISQLARSIAVQLNPTLHTYMEDKQ
jgi:hypothetical protein